MRWLHILVGIVQNTETPMAAILKERWGISDFSEQESAPRTSEPESCRSAAT